MNSLRRIDVFLMWLCFGLVVTCSVCRQRVLESSVIFVAILIGNIIASIIQLNCSISIQLPSFMRGSWSSGGACSSRERKIALADESSTILHCGEYSVCIGRPANCQADPRGLTLHWRSALLDSTESYYSFHSKSCVSRRTLNLWYIWHSLLASPANPICLPIFRCHEVQPRRSSAAFNHQGLLNLGWGASGPGPWTRSVCPARL
jgi:hypothetical protein